jgi:hypothetical protein
MYLFAAAGRRTFVSLGNLIRWRYSNGPRRYAESSATEQEPNADRPCMATDEDGGSMRCPVPHGVR